ncbi:terpenoid synthase [Coprinellus micaceus]|uniref:Terpene synthase n=1 Tax=Coprinellus micaceus TaxID=71717 RepID=A0A4Y7U031_COPMI|nr:terpenoid synthase [Coprinellus micaceus]
METSLAPTSFVLPDLVSHCKFKLSYHPNGDEVAQQSVEWLDTNCPDLNAKQRRALRGLQAGELTAYCYHTASPERLRVVSDFMNYLFHLDNISDGMMTRETDILSDVVMNALWFSDRYLPTKGQTEDELNPGKLARDFWARCIPDCGPGAQARFKETLGFFFEAVNIQARARDEGVIPDLEAYIDVRRDTSGCKPCWALIEYALDIDLPDFVAEHPVIAALNQSTNDLVTWSNDIFSYNVEQSKGDTHNMIVILMAYHGYTLQGAVDYVGDLCQQTIDAFCHNKTKIPSWGPEIDDMVARYVQGLQDWIVGSLHWSFQTHRYFGKDGQDIKKHRIVKLLPLETQNGASPPPSRCSTPIPIPKIVTQWWPEPSLEEYHSPLQKRGNERGNRIVALVDFVLAHLVGVFLGSIFRNFH